MTERPILFSGPTIRAILDGTKTQTRRVVKPQPVPPSELRDEDDGACGSRQVFVESGAVRTPARYGSHVVPCPYGVPGDRLWVRETWAQEDARDLPGGSPSATIYRATATEAEAALVSAWKPSIHMPRWASRITLEVTEVRVERLHDITEEDARAEGVRPTDAHVVIECDADGRAKLNREMSNTHRGAFACLWDSINGGGAFAANPWVWVVCFKLVEVV